MVVSVAVPATSCSPPELIVVTLALPPAEMFWVPLLLMTVPVARPPLETVCIPPLMVVALAKPPVNMNCLPGRFRSGWLSRHWKWIVCRRC